MAGDGVIMIGIGFVLLLLESQRISGSTRLAARYWMILLFVMGFARIVVSLIINLSSLWR